MLQVLKEHGQRQKAELKKTIRRDVEVIKRLEKVHITRIKELVEDLKTRLEEK